MDVVDKGVSLTQHLQAFMQGDSTAVDSLLREILPKLYEIAVRELKKERYMAPVSKTELINELWLRSLSKGGWQIRDRGHFFALASLAMRRVLVDLARNRLAQRRGDGEAALPLEKSGASLKTSVREAEQILELDLAMNQLEAVDPDAACMVNMMYFAGFTLEETAKETGLTVRQVRSRWERGRGRLKKMLRLHKGQDGQPGLPKL